MADASPQENTPAQDNAMNTAVEIVQEGARKGTITEEHRYVLISVPKYIGEIGEDPPAADGVVALGALPVESETPADEAFPGHFFAEDGKAFFWKDIEIVRRNVSLDIGTETCVAVFFLDGGMALKVYVKDVRGWKAPEYDPKTSGKIRKLRCDDALHCHDPISWGAW